MKQRKIIMTLGLPASGKSTWARQYVDEHPGAVRVNKDDLRSMAHNGKHSKGRENFVLRMRDDIVCQALHDGHDVIVDDTNLHPKHKARMEQLATQFNAVVEIKDFTDVPLETCIERDLKRANSVGERVIRQMYKQYLEPKPPKIERDPNLFDAIICDLDGTLALFGDANPYDRDFTNDEVNKPVRNLLWFCAEKIIIVSGRLEKFREQTEEWLRSNGIECSRLFMRPDGDYRKDVAVKEEIYNEHIKGKYNVTLVIDDRLQVCRMWHRLGLPLFRVGDPDADF